MKRKKAEKGKKGKVDLWENGGPREGAPKWGKKAKKKGGQGGVGKVRWKGGNQKRTKDPQKKKWKGKNQKGKGGK